MIRFKPRATDLILLPVLLLAVIAALGLVEYRHAITAEARETAEQWMAKSDRIYDEIVARTEASVPIVLFREIPMESRQIGEDAAKLERARSANDEPTLRELVGSDELTATGVPVRVLAAWQLYRTTEDPEDGEILAELAIHKAPSAISAPIVASIIDTDWWRERLVVWFEGDEDAEWQISERKRAILRAHPNANGFVQTESEYFAFVADRRVLLSEEISRIENNHLWLAKPAWMEARVSARGSFAQRYGWPLRNPIATGGNPIRIEVGIWNPKKLYARYWRVVWWVAGVIVCSLGTALAGSILVRRTVDRERRLGELKSQFVASVSHELRTPVASMRLMADALDAGKVQGDAAREFHRLMSQEGARLSALIENVLDFSRIEDGRKDYQFATGDLATVLKDAVQLMDPVAAERGITIERDISGSGDISLDAGAMEQALVNLIDNAIKFSPEGGIVRVTLVTAAADVWKLAVADCGPGVPAADQERVFERFSRLGNELRRETQGAGIGLSIVKHIVEAHSANIRVADSPGGGAQFIIERTCDS